MDIDKVILARVNRLSREARPFINFFSNYRGCLSAGERLVSGDIDEGLVDLVGRSVVISTVSAVEVYYRDMLDFSFRYCDPNFFNSNLKKLCNDKFDIVELMEIFDRGVHPLEVVSSSQSFQSADRIDKVFSSWFSDGGFWSKVLGLEVRRASSPENVVSWTHEDLDGLKRTFALRHQLVHDPAQDYKFSQENLMDLQKSAHMIFGSDFILCEVIERNKDKNIYE